MNVDIKFGSINIAKTFCDHKKVIKSGPVYTVIKYRSIHKAIKCELLQKVKSGY